MTIISLQQLALFLNKYNLKGRVADYGGTDAIGAQVVEQMLSLKDLSVELAAPGSEKNLLVNGNPRKSVPTYHVLDYDNGIDLLKPIKGDKFDGGICMDLLEHTSNPFIVADNISDSLKKGAMLFVTVPWVWEIHYFPKDYWRFAPQGLEELFPKMKVISMEIIRDPWEDEDLPRQRLVAVFKKR
jgi:SAM-dependent methyltransferase